MKTSTIAIIGGGNMGSSLIGGLIANQHPLEKLCVSDQDPHKLTQLKDQFNIHTTQDNQEAVRHANVVIFAIKPQVFAATAQQVRDRLQECRPLIISIAAGIRLANIEKWLGENLVIVRAMPNTAALIGCSATALVANENINEIEKKQAEAILQSLGITVWLKNEPEMDIVTALSGSGPAYFFLVMEALEKAAAEFGLNAATAKLLTLQTALGAACLAVESDLSPAELRKKVTSPGGTTEKAIEVLEQGNLRELFRKALQAAKIRSEELAKLTGK